jgi:hypothetical protein
LSEVAEKRNLEISWELFSLAYKNNELTGGTSGDKTKGHLAGQRVLRVMQRARKEGSSIAPLYRDLGKLKFVDDKPYDDGTIRSVLASNNLPERLLEAADDTSIDDEIIVSTDRATELVGDDIGVPTIIFHLGDGTQRGFFGPVLTKLPSEEAGLQLWDGVVSLASIPEFSELKRGRDGKLDTKSTARLLS